MTHVVSEASLQRAARFAGLAYLLIIVTSLSAVILIEQRLVVPGDVVATISNILGNEFLYRFGTAYDLVMFASVVALSVALHVVLRTVSRGLALLALLWRLGEAFAGVITVLAGLIIGQLLSGGAHSTALETGQVRALVELLLGVRSAGLDILTVFLCLGTIVFCYLFFRSRYIPRALSVWGMLAFLLMLVVTFVGILVPSFPSMIQTISVIPVALFEVAIGLWLLIRGVSVREGTADRILGSA